MTAMMAEYPTFEFDGYTLRPAAGEQDRALAEAWMEEDPWHKGQFAPEFWLEQTTLVNSFVLEDAAGPVFFFRTQLPELHIPRCRMDVEVLIQFAPGTMLQDPDVYAPWRAQKLRTMRALEKGFAWLRKMLAEAGYDALFFSSSNPLLVQFAERRLEFVAVGLVDGAVRLKAYLERAA